MIAVKTSSRLLFMAQRVTALESSFGKKDTGMLLKFGNRLAAYQIISELCMRFLGKKHDTIQIDFLYSLVYGGHRKSIYLCRQGVPIHVGAEANCPGRHHSKQGHTVHIRGLQLQSLHCRRQIYSGVARWWIACRSWQTIQQSSIFSGLQPIRYWSTLPIPVPY